MQNSVKKIVTVVVALIISAWLVNPGVAQAVTTEELQAQIANLLAQVEGLRAQLATLEDGAPPPLVCIEILFDRNLKKGMLGEDIQCLQALLNQNSETRLASTGVGSPGNETLYFGLLTKEGAIKFQEKYADEILAPWGLIAGTGFVGKTTRDKLNNILVLSPLAPPTPPTPPSADTTLPTVTIISPSKGATVKDTVNFQVSATDESGIQMVYFYIDDAELSSDSTSPYQYNWDTTAYSNGSHKLSAKALDGADNLGSIADTNYTVNVDNPTPKVEEFSNPKAYWWTIWHCWEGGGFPRCPTGDWDEYRECMEAQIQLPDGTWNPLVLKPGAFGCATGAYLPTLEYQGPGGIYWFGPSIVKGTEILYLRYPTSFTVPSATTSRLVEFWPAGGKITAPKGFMRPVGSSRYSLADLQITIYKDIRPPDGLTPWDPSMGAGKEVATWVWPNAFRFQR